MFYGPKYIVGNTVFSSSLASGKNKEYLICCIQTLSWVT